MYKNLAKLFPPPTFSYPYILDAVRSLSILWIAWYHIDKIMLPINQEIVSIRTLANLGFAGVHVFLLLSGFGLTCSMMNKINYDSCSSWADLPWKDFFVRRFIRIYPLYIFAHILFFITGAVLGKYADMPLDIGFLLSITGLRVFFPNYFYYGPDAFWFVGLIIQFYLLFPFLFWLLIKTKKINFLLITFIVCAISRLISVNLHEYYMLGVATNRLAEFSLGMILAYYPNKLLKKDKNQLFLNKRYILITFIFSVFVGLVFHYQPIFSIRIVSSDLILAIATFSGIIIVAWLCSYVPFLYSYLIFLSSVSYSFYLLHSPPIRPAFSVLQSIGINNFWILIFIYISIITLFSYTLTSLEEKLLPLKK